VHIGGAVACAVRGQLVGADDLEVLVDEDVVRPVDADVVNLVLAVARLHNTVDDASRVGGQRSFRRFIRCRDFVAATGATRRQERRPHAVAAR
jgi:hypothetical protein